MAALTDAEVPSPITHERVLVVFSGLLLVMLLAALDSTIVATALPTIVGELGGLAHLSWVVTAYLLAQTVVTPLYGKLGDIYGRKGVLQVAIALFLLGSALCGMSRSMTQLILFRAIQGLGGGGLMVTTQAVVGDIVAPRQRGRYQGIFGAVFAAASIAGPLVGGYFTTHLSWRSIFYINIPLGVIALAVLAVTLPPQGSRMRHAIDYSGAGLLAVALSAIILVTDLGGAQYSWSSPLILGLIGAAIISLFGFVLVEGRADEPVLPLRLFRNGVFWVTSAVGLIIGFSLFGSVTYLPLFLQVVKGASPTASGLQMLPLMGGSLITSILSGQIISRTGRYKIFPLLGTACTSAGLFLLSRMNTETGTATATLIMLLLGLGLGMVMQVLVIAAQNSVGYKDLGVATSGATLFRLIGGSLGAAVLGAIFAARLETNLARFLPPGAEGASIGAGINPQALAQLPAAVRAAYAEAFTASLGMVFLVATAIALLGFLLAWLLPERPLRETIAAATEDDIGGDVGQAFAMPASLDPLAHVLRGLTALADRNDRRRYIERIVTRAGVDLSPAAAWALGRLEKDPKLDPASLARRHQIEPERVSAALNELLDKSLIVETNSENGEGRRRVLTEEGCRVFNRLVAARREHLAELWPDWPPEKREEVAALIRRLVWELVPETSAGNAANSGSADRA
jgi:EmrB/QacA subfamily drug resistance transporter